MFLDDIYRFWRIFEDDFSVFYRVDDVLKFIYWIFLVFIIRMLVSKFLDLKYYSGFISVDILEIMFYVKLNV